MERGLFYITLGLESVAGYAICNGFCLKVFIPIFLFLVLIVNVFGALVSAVIVDNAKAKKQLRTEIFKTTSSFLEANVLEENNSEIENSEMIEEKSSNIIDFGEEFLKNSTKKALNF